jgi:hypothetical protein
MLFRYDGTRWLSEQDFTMPIWVNAASATAFIAGHGWDSASMDVYLGRCEIAIAVTGTNNGSHYWTPRLYSNDVGGSGGGNNLLASGTNTSAMSVDSSQDRSFDVNTVLDVSAAHSVGAYLDKNGSPGTARVYGALHWRYIAT